MSLAYTSRHLAGEFHVHAGAEPERRDINQNPSSEYTALSLKSLFVKEL